MKKFLYLFLLIWLWSFFVSQVKAQSENMTEAAWREDIEFLRERLPTAHPDPYHAISEAEFEAAFEMLLNDLPNLSDAEIVTRILRIVNLLRDGHSGVPLFFNQGYGFHVYPLRFYLFDDGLFVVDAMPGYEEAIGARVVQVGSLDFAAAYETLSLAASYENEWGQRGSAAFQFGLVESLLGNRVIESVEQPNYVLETPAGDELILNPEPVTAEAYVDYFGRGLWNLPQRDEPMYLQSRDPFWLMYMPEEQVIYVQYNAVLRQNEAGESVQNLRENLETLLAENAVRRVIVDLRHNGGGDLNTSRPLLNLFTENEFFHTPGNLILLTSRGTFSAATWFALQVEEIATLIGEPTGGNPQMFENARPLTLPNSGLVIMIASRQRHDVADDDPRQAVEVNLAVPLTSSDFFNGVDPVLAAALEY